MDELTPEQIAQAINDHPLIASLLYDIDLLPEQIKDGDERREGYMCAVVGHMLMAIDSAPQATGAATPGTSGKAVHSVPQPEAADLVARLEGMARLWKERDPPSKIMLEAADMIEGLLWRLGESNERVRQTQAELVAETEHRAELERKITAPSAPSPKAGGT